MIRVNEENVREKFAAVSGCEAADLLRAEVFISSACREIERLINVDVLGEEELGKVEFAAAVSGFYDFLCGEAARDKLAFSPYGKAVERDDFSSRLKAAAELRNTAFCGIREFIRDEDFIFLGI